MSNTFCRLRDANGLEIIINPSTVRYLVTSGAGTTRLCFDNSHTINVSGSPREVQQKLTDQMEVWSPSPAASGSSGVSSLTGALHGE
jgi:hypothetical protein